MLRSDAEVALDEALLAVAESERLHRQATEMSRGASRRRFAAAASLRETIETELAEAARRVGWLPRLPDPDAEAVRALGDELQALVTAGAADDPLAEERHEADRKAIDKLTLLRSLEGLPPPIARTAARCLTRLREKRRGKTEAQAPPATGPSGSC